MPMKVRTERRRTQIHSGGHTTAPSKHVSGDALGIARAEN